MNVLERGQVLVVERDASGGFLAHLDVVCFLSREAGAVELAVDLAPRVAD